MQDNTRGIMQGEYIIRKQAEKRESNKRRIGNKEEKERITKEKQRE